MALNKLLAFCSAAVLATAAFAQNRQAYFADGYHGGIYGHYPLWHTGFMVDKLTQYPLWKVNLEVEPETWDIVKEKDPANYDRLRDFFTATLADNRIEFVNPTYAQPYCYNISGESIIRHFTYGIAKVREHFPLAQFHTYSCEEPCFTSSLPQILSSLGYKYAIIRNPDTCWGGYISAFGKDLVNWTAPDGSQILAVPRYACEGLEENSTWQTQSWNNSVNFINNCFDSGVQFPVGMCFQDIGWKGGPWLENVIRNHYQPSEYILWSEYINNISDKVIATDWHFSIEDVKPGLVWGAQILQQIAQQVRHTENMLIIAEKVATYNTIVNNAPYPTDKLDEAWRNLMLAQHHDCWIVPYNNMPGGNWASCVTDWTTTSDTIAREVINSAMSLNGCEPQTEPAYLTVFNTMGQPRREMVKAQLPDQISSCRVLDLEGNSIPVQILSSNKSHPELAFMAQVPAMGYAAYTLLNGSQQTDTINLYTDQQGCITVNTDYYSARLDPARGGAIVDLIAHKLGNTQLINNDDSLNSLRGYFYNEEKFFDSSKTPATITIEQAGPLLVTIKAQYQIAGSPCCQLITFYQNSPRIDFELNIDWQDQPRIGAYSQDKKYIKEDPKKAFYDDSHKLMLRFPLPDSFNNIYKNAPFDICASTLEDTIYHSWDKIKHNVILNWVDLYDKKSDIGLALFSDHTTSYFNSKETPLGLTVQYAGRALWGRNYKTDGPTKIKYALLPHNKNWCDSQLENHSNQWNEPLLARLSANLPPRSDLALIQINTPGVELVSVTADKKHYLARIFNASDRKQTAVLTLHEKPKKAQLISLAHELITELTPTQNPAGQWQIKLDMPRLAFNTIKIETH